MTLTPLIGNRAISVGVSKASGGLFRVVPKTGQLAFPSPYAVGPSLLLYTGGMAECQSLYCDGNEDGWSDVHHDEMGICVPGIN